MHDYLRHMTAGGVRSEDLPVAAEWSVAGSMALVHMDEDSRVTAELDCGEPDTDRFGSCSLHASVHLFEHLVCGSRTAEIRDRIETLT